MEGKEVKERCGQKVTNSSRTKNLLEQDEVRHNVRNTEMIIEVRGIRQGSRSLDVQWDHKEISHSSVK